MQRHREMPLGWMQLTAERLNVCDRVRRQGADVNAEGSEYLFVRHSHEPCRNGCGIASNGGFCRHPRTSMLIRLTGRDAPLFIMR